MHSGILPHSIETERAVLGSILLDGSLIGELASDGPDLFYVEKHRKIFLAFLVLHSASKPIDLRTVQLELESRGEWQAVGGIAYLAELDIDLPDLGGFDSYVESLRDLYGRRRVIEICQHASDLATERGPGARELAEALARDAAAVAASRTASSLFSIGDVARAAVARAESGSGALEMISTGFYDLDLKFGGGLSCGTMNIIAGRPSMGKTALAQAIGINVAERGKRVGFFSLEMGKEELTLRLLAGELRTPFASLKKWDLSDEAKEFMVPLQAEIDTWPFFIDDSGASTAEEMLRVMEKERLQFAIIDYLQLMTTPKRHENRTLELGAITRVVKQGAKKLKIPIILLSQISRIAERRSADKRPQMSDLRESGRIEEDADSVMLLYREDYYDRCCPIDKRGITEVDVAKHRNGETGIVELLFESQYTRFHNLSRQEPPANFHGG